MNKREQPLILSLETSTRRGSIAVLRGKSILAVHSESGQKSHSAQLLTRIREVLQTADADLKQINVVSAAVGPGGFTGLRIGLATAKALATALKIPSCGIPTLAAAAASAEKNGEICAVLPAGRSEYFAQFFEKKHENELRAVSEIGTFKIENLIEICLKKNNLRLVAAEEAVALFSEVVNNRLTIQILPSNLAISIGQIADQIFRAGECKKHPLAPIYGRGADIGGKKNVA